ncbi:hypothetical protein Ahy_A06g026070 isoform A [Arachis hypogaea]|uniref:Uncharacterized protein n=1 Tax=Arachis hypogaea TaxID=3818 RepID=A0A445CJC3_ARAHY|nr:hypothetical protein Ahy_A06g026070 isoform A [Arachis hypogaea]
MASVCIANCINDARVPMRATYVNLYKWPESDAEFVRSVSSNGRKGEVRHGHPRVVDSISCRQIYLRSYKFSREEDNQDESSQKCFGKKKKQKNELYKDECDEKRKKCLVWKKAKDISCSALFKIFQSCLSCSASVDVMDATS